MDLANRIHAWLSIAWHPGKPAATKKMGARAQVHKALDALVRLTGHDMCASNDMPGCTLAIGGGEVIEVDSFYAGADKLAPFLC